MVDGFARSLFFICGLVGITVIASSVLAYCAHCFLVVVIDTAAGLDEVRWPADSMIDWIGQVVHPFVVVSALLIPVGFLDRNLGDAFLLNYPVLRVLVLGAPWLWLMLPVALLSSMSASSAFVLVRPSIVAALLRGFAATFLFYVVTGVGIFGITALWYVAVFRERIFLIPLAAVLSAGGVLVYARLLGRLGWLVSQDTERPRKRLPGKLRPQLRKQIQVADPWSQPPVPSFPTRPPEGSKRGDDAPSSAAAYDLSDEPPCEPPQFVLRQGTPFLDVKATPQPPPEEPSPQPRPYVYDDDDDDGKPIGLAPDASAGQDTRPLVQVEPSKLEMRLRAAAEAPADPPAFPMFSGVYSFPFYSTSLRAFYIMSIGWLVVGFAVERLVALFPFG